MVPLNQKDRLVVWAQTVGSMEEADDNSNIQVEVSATAVGLDGLRSWWHNNSKFDSEILGIAAPTFASLAVVPITGTIDAGKLSAKALQSLAYSFNFFRLLHLAATNYSSKQANQLI